jgi:hypothetical protein
VRRKELLRIRLVLLVVPTTLVCACRIREDQHDTDRCARKDPPLESRA